MALGAFVVIFVLAAAGLYMPKWKKASAAGTLDSGRQSSTTTGPTTTSQPVQTAQLQPDQTQPVAGSDNHPADAQPSEAGNQTAGNTEPSSAQPKKYLVGTNSHASPSGGTETAADVARLDAIEHEIDQLTSRAGSVNSSLENLQAQQRAQGLGLRGDISEKWASMKNNLAKAQQAIEQNDAARAKRYADKTDADVEALEKFLGR
jgi:hypothetical protein